jgi:tRNA (guanine37-N1)-methyltransferase
VTQETSICIVAPRTNAETIRQYLLQQNILRTDLKIIRENDTVCFPITKSISFIKNKSYAMEKRKFHQQKIKFHSYKDLVTIPKIFHRDLPTSYDVIGDIILIKLKESLLPYKNQIGETLLKVNNHIHVVGLISPVQGEFRTREVEILAGEQRTSTIHMEYGLQFHIDVQNTYFSPRLATERKFIVKQVQSNEVVVDMFTGVAPFSIMIAKYSKTDMIYAFDINEKAIELAQKNIACNKVIDRIELVYLNAKYIPANLRRRKIKADRIIMNLPHQAHNFFPTALEIMNDHCCIHFYDIISEVDIEKRINQLHKVAKHHNVILLNINTRKIKTYAPREFYIALDITAKKLPM